MIRTFRVQAEHSELRQRIGENGGRTRVEWAANDLVAYCSTIWSQACKTDLLRRRNRTRLVSGWTRLCSGFVCWFVLLFPRLFEAVAFTIHLEHVSIVCEPNQQCRHHAFALEDLAQSLTESAGRQRSAPRRSCYRDGWGLSRKRERGTSN